jgi:putative endonuclease
MKTGYVYIVASKSRNALYIGVTSNLIQRIWQHKNEVTDGHSKKYKTHDLVHYEVFGDIERAITREKQLKNWHREWKDNLISEHNPDWEDLYNSLM